MPYDWQQFSSLLGMTEMEVAVCEIVNRLETLGQTLALYEPTELDLKAGHPYGSGTRLFVGDFINKDDGTNHRQGLLVGFACLIGYGWLKPAYPNGYFSPSPGLVEKVNERLQKLKESIK